MTARLPAEKRKAAVLDCACGIFSMGSYHGTTTAEIARKAGVSEPILYRHFASKRDLYLACIEEAWTRLRTTWEEAMVEHPDPRAWMGIMAKSYLCLRDVKINPADLWMQAVVEAGDDVEVRRFL